MPGRQLRAADGVRQHNPKTISRDLARPAQGAADVLMMDGDIKQGKSAPEGSGQPSWPQPVPQPLQQLLNTQRREFVHADLVDIAEPGADRTPQHAEQSDVIETHHVRDLVPYPPSLTQRRQLPLLRSQRRQKLGKISTLLSGHLNTVHSTTPRVRLVGAHPPF